MTGSIRAVALGCCAMSVAAAALAGGSITIRVAGEDGKPVSGARVLVWDRGQPWEAPGEHAVEGGSVTLPRAPAVARVIAPGFAPHELAWDDLRSPRIDVGLGRGVAVRGSAFEAASRRLVGGASLELRSEETSLTVASARSDARGRYVLGPVEPGRYRIVAWGTGLAPASRDVVVGLREGEPVPMALVPGMTVEVRVAGPGDSPVADAWVSIGCAARGAADAPDVATVTGRDGIARLDTAGCSSLRLTARHPDMKPVDGAIVAPVAAKDGPPRVSLLLEPAASVRGSVRDEDGKGIAGAEVWVRDADGAFTGPSGEFLVRGVAGGSHEIAARADGYLAPDELQEIHVPAEGLDGVELTLSRGRALDGVVRDEGRAPVGGAHVMVSSEAGRGEAWTDGKGKFSVSGLGPGELQVVADAPGFQVSTTQVPEGASTADVVLSRGCRIAGRVVDGAGAGVARAEVLAVAVDPEGGTTLDTHPGSETTAGADGTFAITQIPPGSYMVLAHARGFVWGSLPRVDAAPATPREDLRIRLGRGGSISGTVLDAKDGTPLPGATLHAELADWGEPNDGAADGAGRFRIDGVPDGHVELRVTAPGYAPQSRSGIHVSEGEELSGIEIRMSRGGRVQGVVTYRGQPVEAEVRASDGIAATDASGTFDLEGVPAGVVNVEATAHVERPGRSAWVSARQEVRVEAGATARVVLELRGGVTVKGVVTVAGAAVASGSVATARGEAPIAADGTFVLEEMAPGPTTFQIEIPPDGSAVHRADVPAESPASLRIDLPGSGLRGKVLDARTGAAVPHASVQAGDRYAQSVEDGSYELGFLPAGPSAIEARAEGFAVARRTVTLPRGGLLEGVDLLLPPAGEGAGLGGRVTRPDGTPAFPAVVAVTGTLGPSAGGIVGTDADGRFRITDLAPGAHDVVAYMPGSSPVLRLGAPVGPAAPPCDIALPRAPVLRVAVTRASTPVVGAVVQVEGVDPRLAWAITVAATTGPSGIALLADLPAGAHQVVVTSGNESRRAAVTLEPGRTAELRVGF